MVCYTGCQDEGTSQNPVMILNWCKTISKRIIYMGDMLNERQRKGTKEGKGREE